MRIYVHIRDISTRFTYTYRSDKTGFSHFVHFNRPYTVYRHAGLHAPGADLLLATLPSALLIGIVCLYMPCDAADATVATLACTPLSVWRSWQFIGLALGDAVLIVIDVFAIAYAPKHVSGSECALIGLLENILAPLWVSVWKSTSRCRVDGVEADAAIQDERAVNLVSTQVGLRPLRRRALGVDGRRGSAPACHTNRARSRREGAGAGEPARGAGISYSE